MKKDTEFKGPEYQQQFPPARPMLVVVGGVYTGTPLEMKPEYMSPTRNSSTHPPKDGVRKCPVYAEYEPFRLEAVDGAKVAQYDVKGMTGEITADQLKADAVKAQALGLKYQSLNQPKGKRVRR